VCYSLLQCVAVCCSVNTSAACRMQLRDRLALSVLGCGVLQCIAVCVCVYVCVCVCVCVCVREREGERQRERRASV